jgi:hypothetical protein
MGTNVIKKQAIAKNEQLLILLQSMVAIYVNLLLSDMLESDKVGTIYFMIIGLLVALNANLIHFPKDGLVQASEDADSK